MVSPDLTFNLTIADDATKNGTQTVFVRAEAAGGTPFYARGAVPVRDNE